MGGIQGGAIGGGLGAIPRGQRQADRDRSDDTSEGGYGDVARERAAQEDGQAGAASGEFPTVASLEPGDITQPQGRPFMTGKAAQTSAATAGDGAPVLRFANWFHVRRTGSPLDAHRGTRSTSPGCEVAKGGRGGQ